MSNVINSNQPDDEALMQRFGIISIPASRYHYREWRYSRLDDALAQARRDEAEAQRKSSRSPE